MHSFSNFRTRLTYYYWATYKRKALDRLQEKYRSIYKGTVFDIGGRDRGRFKKPKDEVSQWVFVDIVPDHHPDLVLDIANMHGIADASVDTIAAMEVFAHVENIERGLDECARVLKNDGVLVFSVPLMHPIINDPTDFQRWTEMKWRKELTTRGFVVQEIEDTGKFFTLLGDLFVSFVKAFPAPWRYLGYCLYPLVDGIVSLDSVPFFIQRPLLSRYVTGYFVIAIKK